MSSTAPAKTGVFAGTLRVSSAGGSSACTGACDYVFDGNNTASTPFVDEAGRDGGRIL